MLRVLIIIVCACLPPLAFSHTLLVLGDSLSAGYQMAAKDSWPVLIEPKLQQVNPNVKVINASISGDTTGNGLARLPALLSQHQPDSVLIELGANDGLRGYSPALVRTNLNALITLIKEAQAKPILMQIKVPPNYGQRYSKSFAKLYPEVSDAQQVPMISFFLEQIILQPELMKEDGLHPKAEAQPRIADIVFAEIKSLIPVVTTEDAKQG
ncbi:arylesterase [Motilimonas pumila]|uniref:Arylesterase n=1 Tax=Motilimonas pumila TaxID=2303987 RepID=A0A418YCM0_9GAMM|nr:arylesterase [Motilimonas pumila]RJG42279.1 arylesterase [Motilimonas pumila]